MNLSLSEAPTYVEVGGMANIHVTYNLPIDGELSIHYGKCTDSVLESREQHHHKVGGTTIGKHILAKQHAEWKDRRPEKFVWLIPDDVSDCLHAYSGEYLVGKSKPIIIKTRICKRTVKTQKVLGLMAYNI
jgi:hypothetical protein